MFWKHNFFWYNQDISSSIFASFRPEAVEDRLCHLCKNWLMKLKCPLLQNMPSKKNQQNYWSFHPSEPFTIAHFNVRHPVIKNKKIYSNTAPPDLSQVRLNNDEIAEIYQHGKWIPICGHWFWGNNNGATLFCQQLGYFSGIVKEESIAGQVPLPDDGFRIGECKTNDIWGQCTGGCNDHTIGGTHCSDCRSGAMAGLRIECSNGNHYMGARCGTIFLKRLIQGLVL